MVNQDIQYLLENVLILLKYLIIIKNVWQIKNLVNLYDILDELMRILKI